MHRLSFASDKLRGLINEQVLVHVVVFYSTSSGTMIQYRRIAGTEPIPYICCCLDVVHTHCHTVISSQTIKARCGSSGIVEPCTAVQLYTDTPACVGSYMCSTVEGPELYSLVDRVVKP